MPFESIAPDVLGFVNKYIDSFVVWDILSYFHDRPDFERKSTDIALDIGRRDSTIKPWLEKLVEQNILATEDEEGDELTYRYVARSDFKLQMDKFIAATRDRTMRLAIVSKVLQKEAKRL